MEQQSNNNLDALFQKAGEDYPLKTDNHNWNIVAAKLHIDKPVQLNKQNRKWQYAALLLLLLTGSYFLVNSLYKRGASHPTGSNVNEIQQSGNAGTKQNKTKTSLADQPGKTQERILMQTTAKPPAQPNKNTTGYMKLHTQVRQAHENELTSNTNNDYALKETQQLQQPSLPSASAAVNNSIENPNQVKNNITSETEGKKIAPNTNPSNNKTIVKSKSSEHVKLGPQPKTIYGTFFLSPDFSTVKFQHVSKPGYTIGVGIGYRISNRFSAELGLQRLHTNFYSSGKYFDKSNLKLKPTTKIKTVDGRSKLTEVPVDIRYNLLKNNDNLFVTAGTTVALITHTENYDYEVKRDGSSDNISRKFNALTGTKYFSSVNFSIGYQASVSDIFKIKFEPYYQAQTKGLGIGNLPVSNFGVNIGIVKDLK